MADAHPAPNPCETLSRFSEIGEKPASIRVGCEGEGRLVRRQGVLGVFVALLIASVLLLSVPFAPSAPVGSRAPSTPPVYASATTPSIWYNYSDFFNVPYGEWWDIRAPLYGDEPIHADCFNQTAYNDGTCTKRVAGWPAVASYPYMDWAGSGSTNSEGSVTSVYAPYRADITAFNIPGYNLSQPVFLPVLNYAAAPGTSLSFNWNMQYLNTAQFNALTSSPLSCYSGSGANANDGYQLQSKIYLTMDNEEAARLFGATVSTSLSTMQGWWSTNTLPGCSMSTSGKSPGAGPLETAVNSWFANEANTKYDIYNGYDAGYTSLYTNITATVLSPGATGTTQVYIEHGAWGTETLLDRWFYWGNASYTGNPLDSSKAAGWWGMENGWLEGVHYTGTLVSATMNFNLKGVLQYHLQERSAPGPDNCYRGQTTCTEASPSDDTPYWTWGPMLLDYGVFSSQHPAEITRYSGLNYIKTTPGSGDYGTNTSFDYTPISWAAKANEYWNFVFPTNSSTYYQNPATSPLGTDPYKTGVSLPTIASTLSLKQIFPSAYGTWDAAAGTWSVTGGTTESWPAATGPGTYPYEPYPQLELQPANLPPGVTTVPATSITGTGATLNGGLTSMGSATSVTVGFLWGTSSTLSGATNVTAGTLTATGPFSSALTGLTNGVTYYCEAWANGVGFAHGAILSFNTAHTPPTVATAPATGVTATAATLNGDLTGLGTSASATVGFLWGTSSTLSAATNTTPTTETAATTFSDTLAGLTPSTTYYFQAWALGDGFSSGSILSFTTSTTYPQVTTDPASAVITTGANLNGHTTSLGTATSVTVGFLWGTSSTLATATNTTPTTQTAPGAFSSGLSGLTPGTTYYFEAWADGNGFATGSILSFTTGSGATTPPSVTTDAATSIAATTATLNGTTTSLGSATSVTVGFLYGTSSTLAGATNASAGSQTAAGAFSSALAGLSVSTTYYFQAWANGSGFAAGSIASFATTAAAPSPPAATTASASLITTTGATLNGNVGSLGSASSVTVGFLWGTSSTLSGATNVTEGAHTSTGAFTSSLTGLTPGTTYYFEAWANGTAGFAHGAILSFTTQTSTPPSEPTFLGLPAMIGYAVLAVIVIVIVVAIAAVLLMRKRKGSPPPKTPPPESPPSNP